MVILLLIGVILAVALVGIVGPLPLGNVLMIPLQIQDKPEDDTGANQDVAIDQPGGIIYVKINGTWTQVYPAVIL